ncbi:MAG: hypothetical protein KKB51_22855 [Candidatus Riflebacteria bacterium]|nr:hypothetical protein [Candidatus Riflebacteria bacterium]
MTKAKHRTKHNTTSKRNRFEAALLTTVELPTDGVQRPEHWLAKLLWPEFEELPVGLMSITLILMLALEKDLQMFVMETLAGSFSPLLVILFFNLIAFGILALYHVFSKAPKSDLEKRGMIGFAVVCCATSGLLGGYRLYLEQSSWLQLFGIWNVLQGVSLVILFQTKALNEKSMSDQNAPLAGTIANFILVGSLYVILKYGFNLHYIDNFSICVAYAMSVSLWVCDYIYSNNRE